MGSRSSESIRLLRDRGFVQQITEEQNLASCLDREVVTFYAGFDPTASSLHVGSMIPLMAMAHLSRAGLRPIAVLGGGTAMVGDPSGKTEMRQLLTREVIQENRRGIEPQVRRFLAEAGNAAVIVDNADWLASLNYLDFLRDIGRYFSVNRMLSAEAYKLRLEKGLSFIEFNYQILQAYDFLVLNKEYGCKLQIGGDDQWGNILAGTDLIRRVRQVETFGLTFPLITTSTGAKMGKTASGAVWLSPERTSPYDFYQYFISVDDRDVGRFLRLLTFLPLSEIARYEALKGAELREAKQALAFAVTQIVHGQIEAETAAAAAKAAFGGHGSVDLVPGFSIPSAVASQGICIVDLLCQAGLAASKSAARRLIEQGAVRLADRKITAIDEMVLAEMIMPEGTLLHVGKKSLKRISVSD
jgi:tyrosyl-tRNA synthetase